MLEILDPGALTSVQDTRGRRAWRRYGVPQGGAADPWSARLANRLVANPDDAAVLEVVGEGAAIRIGVAAVVAVTGGLSTTVDGIPMPPDSARRVAPGSRIRFGPGSGLRAYVSVGGGLDVEPVLGSSATDLRTGFGGLDGRALAAGDRIGIGRPDVTALPRRWIGTRAAGPLRITAGPQASGSTLRELTAAAWVVGASADRTGVRLEGAPLTGGDEVPSQGLLTGAIQLPPDGLPILMLPDCPVTGGYRVPACIIGADLGRLAQLRTGDRLELLEVSLDEAREAGLRLESELSATDEVDASAADEPGWAGAHG